MKIIKNVPERYSYISKVFDDIIKKSNFNLKFTKLYLHVSNEDNSEIIGDDGIIKIDTSNAFVTDEDLRGIRILLLLQLYRFIIKPKIQTKIKYIEDFSISREMLKKDFIEDMVYFYYNRIMQADKKISTVNKFLEIKIAPEIFSGIDQYYNEFFNDLISGFKYRKEFETKTKGLFNSLKKDLTDDVNIEFAEKQYEKLIKCK